MIDIKGVIDENAIPSSLKRGKAIYQQKKVTDLSYNISGDEISCQAVVSEKRDVHLINLNIFKDGIFLFLEIATATCTCPYEWTGICKHQVAVLMALQNKLARQPNGSGRGAKGGVKRKTTRDPYEISIKDGFNIHAFKGHPNFNDAGTIQWHVRDIRLTDEKIIVEVPPTYWSTKVLEVFITLSEDGRSLYTTLSTSKKTDNISKEELAALYYIDEHNLSHLFKFLSREYRDELLLSGAKKYGIQDPEIAQHYFELNYRDAANPVRLKKGVPNLVPVLPEQDDHVIPGINAVLPPDWMKEKSFLTAKSRSENRELFFSFQRFFPVNNCNICSVVPFVARRKADGSFFKTGIKPYHELGYSELYDLKDGEAALVKSCIATLPGEFAKRFSHAIRKMNNGQQREMFIYDKNLHQLERVWEGLGKNDTLYLVDPMRNTDAFSPGGLITVGLVAERPHIEIDLSCRDGMVVLEPAIKFSTEKYRLNDPNLEWIHPLCGKIGEKLFLLRSARDALLLGSVFGKRPSIVAVAEAFAAFFQNIILPISRDYPLNILSLPGGMRVKNIKVRPKEEKVYLKELDKFILIRPYLSYEGHEINILDREDTIVHDGNLVKRYERNRGYEEEFIGRIKALHPKFEKGSQQGFFSLHIEEFIEDHWFLKMFESFKAQDIAVYGFNDFKNFRFSPHTPQIKVDVSSGMDWFDLKVKVTVGDTQVSLKDVRKALLSKDKYIKLGDGKLGILPAEWIKRLEGYLRIGKAGKETIKINKLHFNTLENIFEGLDQKHILREIREKKNKLRDFQAISEITLPAINATLRDYQKQGVQWLHFLHEFSWGGILADDMGVGKTLQIITFLRSITDKGIKKHLVVVPTTLLFNWQQEIEKFCPSLTYHIYHGSAREQDNLGSEEYDVIITTYGVLVSDIESLRKVRFGYVILDESQAIKNPGSKRFKAAAVLNAQNRLTMTGTPVENNTFDLYAQMTFVNPGLFISQEHFRKTYATQIDKYSDQQAARELNRMIHPFILRRTKEMVARELPPKTEDVIYCSMKEEQRKVYEAFRNQCRNDILGRIEEEGLEKSKLHVLQALTKLRQICNSPALLNDDSNYGNQSVKIRELVRHVEEKTGRHKLLIFSQFVGMLTLIRKQLDHLEIPYAYLDGKSSKKQREENVHTFQNREDVRVMLISLKAGGTGLNLTAADYVYIVDPWWNPAVENQAIDRCYRIGQEKKVIAYRMICKDTLEEKILGYKKKKQDIADAIIKTDEHIMKQISREDIMELLS